MGHHYPFDHSGNTKRHSFGFDVHLSIEATQSRREGKTRERVQAADRGADAGEQMFAVPPAGTDLCTDLY